MPSQVYVFPNAMRTNASDPLNEVDEEEQCKLHTILGGVLVVLIAGGSIALFSYYI